MTQFTINISGEDIPVSIEQHKRFRRCSMRINDSGLRVTVPLRYKEHQWREFIEKHRPWICRTYLKQKVQKKRLPKLELGAKIPLRGNFYTVTETSLREVQFSDDTLLVPTEFCEDLSGSELIHALMEVYISEAGKVLHKLITKWHSHLVGDISSIKLKEMKSRWGSCSSNGTISLNWRLIMAPDEVFEYVFVHELCHLEIQAHNRSFWHKVDEKFPDAAIWRRLLKKNNYALMNFPSPVMRVKTLKSCKIQ